MPSSSACSTFARVLPRIRARCDEDLATRGLTREKVLAAVVRLLELTLIRVGNDEYARLNRSFGLTTLEERHASRRRHVDPLPLPRQVRAAARGRAARPAAGERSSGAARTCPGQDLFQYVDDEGDAHDVTSDDVNDYLREISGTDVTAKDFRTWAGTVLAYRALRALAPVDDDRAAEAQRRRGRAATAGRLGNTPAVARNSYVHPPILDAYLDGAIGGALLEAAEEQDHPPSAADPEEEAEVVALLKARLRAERRKANETAAPEAQARIRAVTWATITGDPWTISGGTRHVHDLRLR